MSNVDLKLEVHVKGRVTGPGDFPGQQDLNRVLRQAFSTGTGAGQANAVFADERTISASASDALDLAGVLTNAFGETLTFTHIRAVVIEADEGNSNSVVVGGAASNAWLGPFVDATDKVTLPPGGLFVWIAPGAGDGAVTAGTGDQLKIANSGAGSAVTYRVTLIGS